MCCNSRDMFWHVVSKENVSVHRNSLPLRVHLFIVIIVKWLWSSSDSSNRDYKYPEDSTCQVIYGIARWKLQNVPFSEKLGSYL